MIFRDREEAGTLLARRVSALLASSEPAGSSPPLVLALPRGGVVVAAQVAAALHAPLDVLVARKIGAPWQSELAIGAVTDHTGQPEVLLNREMIAALGVDDAYLQREIAQEHAEALRRLRIYRGNRAAPAIANRTVIVVDDGIATGATVKVALQAIRRQHPQRLILAVPVAPIEALDELRNDEDDIVCLSSPADFRSVGSYYRLFDQTSDEQVIALLRADMH